MGSRQLCDQYATHLAAAAHAGGRHGALLPHARRVFDATPERNLVTGNSLLSALARARGHVRDMERLFASLPRRDAVSYNALLAGLARAGAHARAAGAYRALLRDEDGVRPSRITMLGLVMDASALGDRALGRQAHGQILRLGFAAYAFTGSPLVGMYAKAGLVGDARRVFDEMEGNNVVLRKESRALDFLSTINLGKIIRPSRYYHQGLSQVVQGNIAKWVKKEGDKVSPGEVLCKVETQLLSLIFEFFPLDKATVEMECMEEGYLAKIVQGDGAKEIKVGERVASRSLKTTNLQHLQMRL
ncbi:hypothetical protein BRADI_3g00880v3 [Brachypodium distachyon]|uniref:Lipoyl-binding domain-containing protein n=1 Tax=Brachypodium distachyon TaxID=15368 RepID=I1HW54_BRADI|nr:hypothetical protein BRADI_3g00880v3 [Brachypodium distachyon]